MGNSNNTKVIFPGRQWGREGERLHYGSDSSSPRIRTGDLVVSRQKLFIMLRVIDWDWVSLFPVTYETIRKPWPPSSSQDLVIQCGKDKVSLVHACVAVMNWEDLHAIVFNAFSALEAMMLNFTKDNNAMLQEVIETNENFRNRRANILQREKEGWSEKWVKEWTQKLLDEATARGLLQVFIDLARTET